MNRTARPEDWILHVTFAAVAIVLLSFLVAGSVSP